MYWYLDFYYTIGALFVVMLVTASAKAKVFAKAGLTWRGAFIPGYTEYLLFSMAGRSHWASRLLFLPWGLFLRIIAQFYIAKKFGKGNRFGVGLNVLPVLFYPILAFSSKAVYQKDSNHSRVKYGIGLTVLGAGWVLFLSGLLWTAYHRGQVALVDRARLMIQVAVLESFGEYLVDEEVGIVHEEDFLREDPLMLSWEDLQPYLKQLKKGDILFSQSERYLSSALVPGERTHAFLYWGHGEILDASSKGVLVRSFKDLSNLQRASVLRRLTAFRPQFTKQEQKRFFAWFAQQIGKPYDFDYSAVDQESFYCSNLIADGIQQIRGVTPYTSEVFGRVVLSPQNLFDFISDQGTQGGFEPLFLLQKKSVEP